MSAERARRATRLVDLRQREVDLAQTASAAAARAVAEAERVALEAEELWAHESAAPAGECASSEDLAEASAWLRTLRTLADRTEAQAVKARAEARQRHEALVAARSELRKIELWREGLVASARALLDRKERTADDEIAARSVRRQA